MLTFCLGVGPDVDDRLVYLCLVNAVLAIPDAKRESDGTRGSESRPFDPDFFHFDSLRQPVLPNILQLYQAIRPSTPPQWRSFSLAELGARAKP